MKTLIMRTINYEKVWEGIQKSCKYDGTAYKIIKIWEPSISNIKINEVKYGIGIYAFQYFTGIGGVPAFQNTEGELKPSKLILNSVIEGSDKLLNDNGMELEIAYKFQDKFDNFDKDKMLRLDKLFVNAKRSELGEKFDYKKTSYTSLCFTLDEVIVEQSINKIVKNIN